MMSAPSKLPSKADLMARLRGLKKELSEGGRPERTPTSETLDVNAYRSQHMWSEKSQKLEARLKPLVTCNSLAGVTLDRVTVLGERVALGAVDQILINPREEQDEEDFAFAHARIGHALRYLECRWVGSCDHLSTANSLVTSGDVAYFLEELLAERLPQRKLSLKQKTRKVEATLKGQCSDGSFHLRPICSESDLVLALHELLDSELYEVGAIHLLQVPIDGIRVQKQCWYEACYTQGQPLRLSQLALREGMGVYKEPREHKDTSNTPDVEVEVDVRPFLCPLSTPSAFLRTPIAMARDPALVQAAGVLVKIYQEECKLDEYLRRCDMHLQAVKRPDGTVHYRVMHVLCVDIQRTVAISRCTAVGDVGARATAFLDERNVMTAKIELESQAVAAGSSSGRGGFKTKEARQVALMDQHLVSNWDPIAAAAGSGSPCKAVSSMDRLRQPTEDLALIKVLQMQKSLPLALASTSCSSGWDSDSVSGTESGSEAVSHRGRNVDTPRDKAATEREVDGATAGTGGEGGRVGRFDEDDEAPPRETELAHSDSVTADAPVYPLKQSSVTPTPDSQHAESTPDTTAQDGSTSRTASFAPPVLHVSPEVEALRNIELTMDTHMMFLSRAAAGLPPHDDSPTVERPRAARSQKKVVGLMRGYLKAFADDISKGGKAQGQGQGQGRVTEAVLSGQDKEALENFRREDARSKLSRRKDTILQKLQFERACMDAHMARVNALDEQRQEDSRKVHAFAAKLSPLEVLHLPLGGASTRTLRDDIHRDVIFGAPPEPEEPVGGQGRHILRKQSHWHMVKTSVGGRGGKVLPSPKTAAELAAEKEEEEMVAQEAAHAARQAKHKADKDAAVHEGHEVLEILLSYVPEKVALKVRVTTLKKFQKDKAKESMSAWDVMQVKLGKGGMSMKRLATYLTQKGNLLTEEQMEILFRRLSSTNIGGKRRLRSMAILTDILKARGKFIDKMGTLQLLDEDEDDEDEEEHARRASFTPHISAAPPLRKKQRDAQIRKKDTFSRLGDTREIPILEELDLDSDDEAESKPVSESDFAFNDSISEPSNKDVPVVVLPQQRPVARRPSQVRSSATGSGITMAGRALRVPAQVPTHADLTAGHFQVNVVVKKTGADWTLRIEQMGKMGYDADADTGARRSRGILYGGLVDGEEALGRDLWMPTVMDGALALHASPTEPATPFVVAPAPRMERSAAKREQPAGTGNGKETPSVKVTSSPQNHHSPLLRFLLDTYS